MIVDTTKQCAYCRSPIVSGQRWVREKLYDPGLGGRDPSYHRYHAEPFPGQEGSCWEKHQMEVEIGRAFVKEKPLNPDNEFLNDVIQLAQRGDPEAFELIYRQHSRRVYNLCLRMARNSSDAEDLTQEAFMQLFRKIHTFRGESAFSSWLHRITANIVLMRLRRKKPVPTPLEQVFAGDDGDDRTRYEAGGPDLRLTGIFDRFNLRRAVNQLAAGYKATFILHDVHGYDHTEIAEILGCSVGTSKSQLHKARKQIREFLGGLSTTGSRADRREANRLLELNNR